MKHAIALSSLVMAGLLALPAFAAPPEGKGHGKGHGNAKQGHEYASPSGVRVDAVYTSPLERTRETAAPTAARTGREAVVEPGLLECDFGEWTGEELSRLSRLKAWSTVQRAPSTFRFPGGESFPEMQARTVGAVDRVRAAHEGGVVVCFSHADPIKAALAHALGTHLDLFQRIVVSPCSVSAISYAPGQAPAVLTVNSTDQPLAGLRVS